MDGRSGVDGVGAVDGVAGVLGVVGGGSEGGDVFAGVVSVGLVEGFAGVSTGFVEGFDVDGGVFKRTLATDVGTGSAPCVTDACVGSSFGPWTASCAPAAPSDVVSAGAGGRSLAVISAFEWLHLYATPEPIPATSSPNTAAAAM